jgi:hypothetical protein
MMYLPGNFPSSSQLPEPASRTPGAPAGAPFMIPFSCRLNYLRMNLVALLIGIFDDTVIDVSSLVAPLIIGAALHVVGLTRN